MGTYRGQGSTGPAQTHGRGRATEEAGDRSTQQPERLIPSSPAHPVYVSSLTGRSAVREGLHLAFSQGPAQGRHLNTQTSASG